MSSSSLKSKGKTSTTQNDGKIVLLVTCFKCKKQVDSKNTITCVLCSNSFEYDCLKVKNKNTNDLKASMWSCNTCKQENKLKVVGDQSNVTKRKNKTSQKCKPNKEISKSELQVVTTVPAIGEDSYVFLNSGSPLAESHRSTDQPLSRSMDCDLTDLISVQEIQESMEKLKLELSTSQNELEIVILENNDLREQIMKLNKDNYILKNLLTQSPTSSARKKHRHTFQQRNMITTPIASQTNTDISGRVRMMQENVSDLEEQNNC